MKFKSKIVLGLVATVLFATVASAYVYTNGDITNHGLKKIAFDSADVHKNEMNLN